MSSGESNSAGAWSRSSARSNIRSGGAGTRNRSRSGGSRGAGVGNIAVDTVDVNGENITLFL